MVEVVSSFGLLLRGNVVYYSYRKNYFDFVIPIAKARKYFTPILKGGVIYGKK